jgi:DNA-binding response OmpR family regulator
MCGTPHLARPRFLMPIAVLDRNPRQCALVCQVLGAAGHACHAFKNAREMLTHLRKDACDMLILDWQTVGADGAEVLRQARDKLAPGAPVLFLSDYASEDDILAGLAAGADDYLLKPLRGNELLARVQAQLRRAYPGQHSAEQLQFEQYLFEIRPGRERPGPGRPALEKPGHERPGRLLMAGTPLDVTHKEFSLALLFFRNLGRPLSRAYIQESVWQQETALPSRTLDTHVSRVRNKLRLLPENGLRLAPVYSYGYLLEKLEAQTATDSAQ